MTDRTTTYVNGTQFTQFIDSGHADVIATELNFLRDDFVTGQSEAAPGFVDYIQIYDTALTAAEVAGLPGGVPEPANWALMLVGFGLTGATIRQRRSKPAMTCA